MPQGFPALAQAVPETPQFTCWSLVPATRRLEFLNGAGSESDRGRRHTNQNVGKNRNCRARRLRGILLAGRRSASRDSAWAPPRAQVVHAAGRA